MALAVDAIRAFEAYERKNREMLEMVRKGQYGSPECNAVMEELRTLWGSLTAEQQASVEGSTLLDHELTGDVVPEGGGWVDATP